MNWHEWCSLGISKEWLERFCKSSKRSESSAHCQVMESCCACMERLWDDWDESYALGPFLTRWWLHPCTTTVCTATASNTLFETFHACSGWILAIWDTKKDGVSMFHVLLLFKLIHPASPFKAFPENTHQKLDQTLHCTEGREFSFAKSCLELRESLKGGFTYSPMLMLRIAWDMNEEGIHMNTQWIEEAPFVLELYHTKFHLILCFLKSKLSSNIIPGFWTLHIDCYSGTFKMCRVLASVLRLVGGPYWSCWLWDNDAWQQRVRFSQVNVISQCGFNPW